MMADPFADLMNFYQANPNAVLNKPVDPMAGLMNYYQNNPASTSGPVNTTTFPVPSAWTPPTTTNPSFLGTPPAPLGTGPSFGQESYGEPPRLRFPTEPWTAPPNRTNVATTPVSQPTNAGFDLSTVPGWAPPTTTSPTFIGTPPAAPGAGLSPSTNWNGPVSVSNPDYFDRTSGMFMRGALPGITATPWAGSIADPRGFSGFDPTRDYNAYNSYVQGNPNALDFSATPPGGNKIWGQQWSQPQLQSGQNFNALMGLPLMPGNPQPTEQQNSMADWYRQFNQEQNAAAQRSRLQNPNQPYDRQSPFKLNQDGKYVWAVGPYQGQLVPDSILNQPQNTVTRTATPVSQLNMLGGRRRDMNEPPPLPLR